MWLKDQKQKAYINSTKLNSPAGSSRLATEDAIDGLAFGLDDS
jgi:hypothetical protein